jgi:hypothetical protein
MSQSQFPTISFSTFCGSCRKVLKSCTFCGDCDLVVYCSRRCRDANQENHAKECSKKPADKFQTHFFLNHLRVVCGLIESDKRIRNELFQKSLGQKNKGFVVISVDEAGNRSVGYEEYLIKDVKLDHKSRLISRYNPEKEFCLMVKMEKIRCFCAVKLLDGF